MKLIKILKAYWNYLTKPMNKELKKERLAICTPCEKNSTPGMITTISICKSCGCVLDVKANDPDSKCPKKKWKK
jgi:hypothetical protein